MAPSQMGSMATPQTGVLATLPAEILKKILKSVSQNGLLQLSQTCKRLYGDVDAKLWESLTVDPRDRDRGDFPWAKIVHVQHLHFRIKDPSFDTCNSFQLPEIVRFVYTLLSKLKIGQLQSFSWDISAVFHSIIFGDTSQLLRQRTIKHLQLGNCIKVCLDRHPDRAVCGFDLFAGRQLKTLKLRAPPICSLHGRSRRGDEPNLVRTHAATLEELHVDLVNYSRWSEWPHLTNRPQHVEDMMMLGLVTFNHHLVPQPTLPRLRVLSLTVTPAPAALARVLTLDKLTSLTLRNCPGVEDFISELRYIIRDATKMALRKFEFQRIPEFPPRDMDLTQKQTYMWGLSATVFYAIGEFTGLEELYIDTTMNIKQFFSGLKKIAVHKLTLKRLVLSDRPISHQQSLFALTPPLIMELCDMNEYSITNRQALPRLEFLGIECRPSLMMTFLPIVTATDRLQVIHMRLHYGYARDTETLREVWNEYYDDVMKKEDTYRAEMLSELVPEAEKLFLVVPSLRYIAYGNFWRGAREDAQIVLKRETGDEGDWMTSLVFGSPEWCVFMEDFGESLEACPESVIPVLPEGALYHRYIDG
ncbi:hypothetical protein GGR57DRAFT_507182 [Xylariaceae sp. FL1272]|nr:hypothetical protein GGR57DRAFT_507182 [Xylariaceae sp. FL1272]